MLKKVKSKMRLTTQQRLAALERDNVVLHDTIKLLHKLLKEQRQLIKDYITQEVMSGSKNDGRKHDKRPDNALYTSFCRQRFEVLERNLEKMHRSGKDTSCGLKAG